MAGTPFPAALVSDLEFFFAFFHRQNKFKAKELRRFKENAEWRLGVRGSAPQHTRT